MPAVPKWAGDAVAHLPQIIPIREVAEFLNRSRRQLRRDIRRGRLRALKTSQSGSGRVLVTRAALAQFVANLIEPTPFQGGNK